MSQCLWQYLVLPPANEDTSLLLRVRRLLAALGQGLDLDVGPVREEETTGLSLR